MDNQKNLILAVACSILVLIIFDFLVNKPQNERAFIDSNEETTQEQNLDPVITNQPLSSQNINQMKERSLRAKVPPCKRSRCYVGNKNLERH